MKKRLYLRWWFIALVIVILLAATLAIVWSSSAALQGQIINFVYAGSAADDTQTREGALASVKQLGTDVSYESRFDNGVMDVYAMQSSGAQSLIVYTHGGYYLNGDKSGLTDYCKRLASYGYVVANLNYAFAPGARFPTQILQVNEAIGYLLAHAEEYGIDPARVFIAGDSAGAHLASQMGLYYTNPAFCEQIGDEPAILKEQLRGVVLHCGYYNTDTVRATNFPMIAESIWMMTGEKEFEGTLAGEAMNTVNQITPDYPAAFLDCGDQDLFITQAAELIDALEQNKIAVTAYLPTSGKTALQHEFQLQLDTAEGQESMERLAGFLAEQGE